MSPRPRWGAGKPVSASGTRVSGAYAADPSLVPGLGFKLNEQGTWDVEQVPDEVIKESEFSGYLTIHGYKSAVFETADKQMWAQKTTEAEEEVSESETEFERKTEMKPSQVSSILRRIATAIDKSRKPDKNLVAEDLKKVIAAIHRQAYGDPGMVEVYLHFPNGDAEVWMQKEDNNLKDNSSVWDWNIKDPNTVVLHVSENATAPGQAANSPVFHVINLIENGMFQGSGVEVYEHGSSL